MSESGPARPGRSAVRKTEDAVLRSLTVAMVQAADFAELHDVPPRWQLDRPGIGRVLVEREVGARLMAGAEVTVEVSLDEHEHVIEALAPDRSGEPLRERVLPRALRRRENLVRSPYPSRGAEWLPINAVAVADEIGRRGLVREGVHDP
jgi:hypothetical protein